MLCPYVVILVKWLLSLSFGFLFLKNKYLGSRQFLVKSFDMDTDSDDSSSSDDEWIDFLMDSSLRKRLLGRSIWVHQLNLEHDELGEYVTLCVKLRQFSDKFFDYFRMSVDTFDYILSAIHRDISKSSLNFRRPIPADERLGITLRYLAHGFSFRAVAQSFRVDNYTVGKIVKEVCNSVYRRFVETHMPIPTVAAVKKIAEAFEKKWYFPNVVGCIDGKHIRMRCPAKGGSMYYNYKSFHSIVLQGVVDAHCRFLFIDVGGFGKQNDGGTYQASSLYNFVEADENFPPHRFIPGIEVAMPYTYVADDAYPLRKRLLKPYGGSHLTRRQRIFDGRLSRARITVERIFGILAAKWRILLKSIETSVDTAEIIVKCVCMLHNIVINKDGIDDQSMRVYKKCYRKLMGIGKSRRNNSSPGEAIHLRDIWADYFQTPRGSVSWQN